MKIRPFDVVIREINRHMKKLLSLLLLVCAPVFAATYYVCDCASGAAPSCAAGNNSNSGTLPSAPKLNVGAINLRSLAAGDSVLWCRGGAWSGHSSISIDNQNSTAANPITLGAYTSQNFSSTARPTITFAAGSGAFSFSTYTASNGYNLQDLRLIGAGASAGVTPHGIFVYAGSRYITISNLYVENFYYGFNSSQGGLGSVTSGNITVKNTTFYNNWNGGAFIATDNTTFENNTFDLNGYCNGDTGTTVCQPPMMRHSLYVGGDSTGGTRNIVLRGNSSTRVATASGKCDGTHVTGHGIISGMIVENNLVYETSAGGGCYGIGYGDNYGQSNEGVTGAVYRGNTVVNVGNEYFTFNAEPGVVVENNVAINTSISNGGYGNAFTAVGRNNSTSMNSSAYNFRNNSAYYASGSSGASFVYRPGVGGSSTGTSNIVANNLVYIAAGSSASCWNINGKASSDFATWNYNLCRQLGSGSVGGANMPYTGAQANGLTSDPLLVSMPTSAPWSMAIQLTSPARGAGSVSLCAATDKTGLVRGTSCDIGAFQTGGSSIPPSPPATISVQ